MVRFSKYEGLGNDFVIIDARQSEPGSGQLTIQQSIKICDRHFGVGADGIIYALPPENTNHDFSMKVVNADGSIAMMCGNGIRCLARFIYDVDALTGPKDYDVWTDSGLRKVSVHKDAITVCMGVPKVLWHGGTLHQRVVCIDGSVFEVISVDMGNPHAVFIIHIMQLCEWV
jgi:diaminopimelate epimerase